MEVILDQQSGGNTTTATLLESITLEMCDGRDRETDRVTKLVQGTKSDTKEITPDKPEEDSLNDMNTLKSTVEGESGTISKLKVQLSLRRMTKWNLLK
jgi:hypothetical protein